MRALLLLLLAGPVLAADPADLAVRVAALEQNVLGLDTKLERILAAIAGSRGNVTVTNNANAPAAGRGLDLEGWTTLPDGTFERTIRIGAARQARAPEVAAAEVPFTLRLEARLEPTPTPRLELPPPRLEARTAPPPTLRLEAPRITPATIAPIAAAPSIAYLASTPTVRIPTYATAAGPLGVTSAGGCVNGNCGRYRAVSTVTAPGYRARSVVRQK